MPKAIYVKIGVSRWIVHCAGTDAARQFFGSLSYTLYISYKYAYIRRW
mgnify:CR=1 FL=1